MIILQFYKNDGHARVFDKNKWLVDINRREEKLTLERVEEILEKLGIDRTEWKETDWGWQCELNPT